MHKPSTRSEAFTLIEMTVVILIIIILMGFVFTAGQGVLDRSRKVQAKNDVTQIVTAVNAFYTEYGKYPLSDQGAEKTLPGDYTQDQLMNVLRRNGLGWDDPLGNNLNPRRIVFSPRPLLRRVVRRGEESAQATVGCTILGALNIKSASMGTTMPALLTLTRIVMAEALSRPA
jgi:type II secretory pathway pseudopilin PulG